MFDNHTVGEMIKLADLIIEWSIPLGILLVYGAVKWYRAKG